MALASLPSGRLQKSTTKVSIVYDGSARFQGVSLNDEQLNGPKLQQDLTVVLLRFRKSPVAVGSDITEMYMQVAMAPEDRPFHRFLGSVHLKSVGGGRKTGGGGGSCKFRIGFGGGQVNSALDLGGSYKFRILGKKPVMLHFQIIIYLLKII